MLGVGAAALPTATVVSVLQWRKVTTSDHNYLLVIRGCAVICHDML